MTSSISIWQSFGHNTMIVLPPYAKYPNSSPFLMDVPGALAVQLMDPTRSAPTAIKSTGIFEKGVNIANVERLLEVRTSRWLFMSA